MRVGELPCRPCLAGVLERFRGPAGALDGLSGDPKQPNMAMTASKMVRDGDGLQDSPGCHRRPPKWPSKVARNCRQHGRKPYEQINACFYTRFLTNSIFSLRWLQERPDWARDGFRDAQQGLLGSLRQPVTVSRPPQDNLGWHQDGSWPQDQGGR